mmetsp:Transcript_21318/g.44894  ORF Transcript_21318/g.44894 Transcript_21318/m.44894 type:complete len:97 (+) Transcript_21318:652-942(+)
MEEIYLYRAPISLLGETTLELRLENQQCYRRLAFPSGYGKLKKKLHKLTESGKNVLSNQKGDTWCLVSRRNTPRSTCIIIYQLLAQRVSRFCILSA